jgi:hypothetical protein
VLTTSRDICDFVLSVILILVLTVKFTNCNEVLIYTFRIYCQLICDVNTSIACISGLNVRLYLPLISQASKAAKLTRQHLI